MLNVLVTGGAGYIGSHCCKQLCLQGHNPITMDNLVYGHRQAVKWGEFYRGDIGNPDHLEDCLTKYRIDAVMAGGDTVSFFALSPMVVRRARAGIMLIDRGVQILETGVLGTFCALDFFLFFIFCSNILKSIS